ncbi:TetR/AcrR family transcriptional regulator [Angustibacter luteus]|uniref:TetR/AcrR family transcriptional regulator n=1 Tax=Angustibacter luteus TaxID=658456 RepID=A0ABW1JC46_9ACTN
MTRGRRSVDVRREEILSATIEVVDRLGLAATRVSDVAHALHISPGLIFYHFGTKDALVADAFAHAVERDLSRLDAANSRGRDPLDRLRRVLRLYGPTGAATGWRLWIDAWALAQREPVIRKALRGMDQRWCTVLREVVEDGVEDGTFECAEPAAAVTRVSALLDGLSVAMLVYRTVTRAELKRWVAESVARELGLDPADLV